MGEVRSIDDAVIVSGNGTNEDCITGLERLLQQARDGEVVGVAVSIQYKDGSNAFQTSGFLRNYGTIGTLMHLVHRLTNV